MDRTIREIDGLQFILTGAARPEARAYIHQQIKAFNNAVSENHRTIRQSGPQPLDILTRDRDGQLRGGLIASYYWGWLELEDFWLDESLRGFGYGRAMLSMVEDEAQARGCARAFLKTFSFQAKGLYEKLGYRVVGRLDDYPPGETFFWMRKDF